MPRRRSTDYTRVIEKDPRFGSVRMQKFINVIMERGKKSVARDIVYGAIDIIAKKSNGDEKKAIETFNQAFEQVAPAVEVRSRRVGGSVYQIPTEVVPKRKDALAMRWLISASKERPNKTMKERLAFELLDASQGKGGAVKKRVDVQRMAEANRAFSHYAW